MVGGEDGREKGEKILLNEPDVHVLATVSVCLSLVLRVLSVCLPVLSPTTRVCVYGDVPYCPGRSTTMSPFSSVSGPI
jgi:hypothetical protein